MKLLGLMLFSLSLSAEISFQELIKATLYEEACAILEKQIELNEEETFALAKCYFALERYENVIALLEKKPLNLREKHLLACAYQKNHHYDASIFHLKALPKSEKTTYDLAVSYFFNNEYAEAEALLNDLVKNSINKLLLENVHFFLIKLDLERGFLDSAENKLRSTFKINQNPEFLATLQYLEGDLYFRKKQYEKAICCFETICPKKNHKMAIWYQDTLYQLGWCYLNMAELTGEEMYFVKAENAFKQLSTHSTNEKIWLSYVETLLRKGKYLKDETAFMKANQILETENVFISTHGKNRSLLMKAEAAFTYEEREIRYAALVNNLEHNSLELAEGWYFRGLNEWNEGQIQHSKKHFKRAIEFLKRANEIYTEEPFYAALSLKLIAKCYLSQNNEQEIQEAISFLTHCIQQGFVAYLEDPLEVYYLKALAEMKIHDGIGIVLNKACNVLSEGISSYRKGAYLDKSVYLLGQMLHQNGNFEEAEQTFLQVIKEFPNSLLCAQALYAASLSAKAAKKEEALIKHYKQEIFEKYPQEEVAAIAYFTYYSYHEYLDGDKKVLKHLQALPLKFPESVFSLSAYYLLGMDLKRDRRSPLGKWISKKNLTHAVEAFFNVESCFDKLFKENKIPLHQLEYYTSLRYRAILERALANYAIAQESREAKKQIYLEYASDVLRQIIDEFNEEFSLAMIMKGKELFPKIVEESCYYLAKIYWQIENVDMAEKIYKQALTHYQNSNITKSYFLAKLYTDRGFFSFDHNIFEEALFYFKKAAESGSGKILNSDETLSLLIQQSLCLQAMNNLEEAMLLLSEVINCDIASSLRVKAMFIRAEIYETQGRQQLAKRQLETIVAKGGDWAQKAQEKLEKEYGFY